MSNLIFGIDSSKTATGVCLWDVEFDCIHKSDVIKDMEPGKFSRWLQTNGLPAVSQSRHEIVAAYIETPILFITGGKGSAATIAAVWHTLGMIEGELSWWGIISERLPPATWRKHLLGKNPAGGGWSKAHVLPHLREMFPSVTREDELEACGIAKVGAMLWREEQKGE